jgi:hypothetical protein
MMRDIGLTILLLTMCAVVVRKTSWKDRNHPILRGVIAQHQEIFFFTKIMIFLKSIFHGCCGETTPPSVAQLDNS